MVPGSLRRQSLLVQRGARRRGNRTGDPLPADVFAVVDARGDLHALRQSMEVGKSDKTFLGDAIRLGESVAPTRFPHFKRVSSAHCRCGCFVALGHSQLPRLRQADRDDHTWWLYASVGQQRLVLSVAIEAGQRLAVDATL